MVLQDLKDGRGGVAGVLGGVLAGMSGDPETDGAEGLLEQCGGILFEWRARKNEIPKVAM